jgi:flagellar protein FliO/FliZ
MNLFLKWIMSFLFAMALFSGNQLIARAEPFDSNVKECIEKPDLCTEEKPADSGKREADSKAASEPVGIGFLDVFRMIAALAFVVALLYFLLRFINKKSRSYQENYTVRHLGGTALGGTRSVQVVKVGDRLLILGVGENVALLKEIEDEQERNELLARYEEQSGMMVQPSDIINRIKLQVERKKQASGSSDFKQELERKMDDLKKSRGQAVQDLINREQSKDE